MRGSASDGPPVLSSVGTGCAAVTVATAPWNAVAVGPIKIAYLALAASLFLLGLDAVLRRRSVRIPGWIWLLAAAVGVVCVLSVVFPVDGGYIAGRYSEGFPALATDTRSLQSSSVVAGLKWIVAVIGLATTVCLAAAARRSRVRVLAVSWLAGVTASALVALIDQLAGTRIAGGVLPSVSFDTRQAGLSIHPNHLAVSIVMAMPVVVSFATRSRGSALVLSLTAGLVMIGGLLCTGSRAGVVGAAVAIPAIMLIEPRTRRLVPVLAGAAVAVITAIVLVRPQVLTDAGRRLRFVNNSSADASDTIRAGLGKQAVTDFRHSPVHGIGFEVLSQGHDIYLQLLANGGVILLVGFVVAQLWFFLDAWKARPDSLGIGRALTVSGITFLIIGAASNQLADLFVYIPFALVAGLRAPAGIVPVPTARAIDRASVGPDRPGRTDVHDASHIGLRRLKLPRPTRVVCPA